MPKTFGEINKELEVAHIKLSAISDPKQRREILVEMRKLLEQADNLVQELQHKIPSK
jgi:formiminotetrahydrofolate cyclodeaminase